MQFENSLQFRGEQEIPPLHSQRASSLLFLHRILQCWYLGCTSSPHEEPRFNDTVCSGKIEIAGTGHRSTGQTAFVQVGGLAACKAGLSGLCAPPSARERGYSMPGAGHRALGSRGRPGRGGRGSRGGRRQACYWDGARLGIFKWVWVGSFNCGSLSPWASYQKISSVDVIWDLLFSFSSLFKVEILKVCLESRFIYF